MDIQFYGANCVAISTSKVRVVVDDNLMSLGGKSVLKAGDIALFTAEHAFSGQEVKMIVDGPGEYEASEVSIYGIPMRAHMDEEKQTNSTMYKIITNDIKVLVAGHVYPEINESQLEEVGMVDILIVPVGGNGYTLDPVGATTLVKEIEPKLVIPVYYDDSSLKFPIPAQTLEQALQGLGIEPRERTTKLKVKSADFGESTQLVVLEKA
jgi:L-ascorbate metabolism protein UlaG (beta-lactamase superfamily)